MVSSIIAAPLTPSMNTSDEFQLIEWAKSSDLDAFNRLVAIHQNGVYGFVLRLVRQASIADDVTQETFIAAFRSIRNMRGRNFRSWVLTIARNKSYDHFRRADRRRETSVDDEESDFENRLPSHEPNPEERALGAELKRAIERCMGRLANDQRLAVLLVDVQGHSYDEASAISGVSIGTIKSRLSRARRRIRDCLQQTPELLPLSMRGQGA